jgi:hypothetical protein
VPVAPPVPEPPLPVVPPVPEPPVPVVPPVPEPPLPVVPPVPEPPLPVVPPVLPPPTQAPFVHDCPDPQTFPQLPQLLGFDEVSMQVPLQFC